MHSSSQDLVLTIVRRHRLSELSPRVNLPTLLAPSHRGLIRVSRSGLVDTGKFRVEVMCNARERRRVRVAVGVRMGCRAMSGNAHVSHRLGRSRYLISKLEDLMCLSFIE